MDTKKFFGFTLVAVFMVALSTTGFPSDNAVTSTWTVKPPNIDGLSDDWQGDTFSSEKQINVHYAVRNDAQNMYVLLVFKDKKSLSSISATGITLYYDVTGKKKKDYAHNFIKKQVTGDELIAYMGKQGQILTEEKKQSIRAKGPYVVLMVEKTGKKNKKESDVASGSVALRPGFMVNSQDGAVIYEFILPLIKSESSPQGIGIEPGQSLKLGFEWGGMTDEMRKRMNRALAESGGDVSRERRTGATIDSSRGGRGMPRGERGVPTKHSFWIDVKLAQEL
jgi:hypothetical protein